MCAKWNPDAITLANSSVLDSSPSAIFVNTNNSVFVTGVSSARVQVWLNENITQLTNVSAGLSGSNAVFVHVNGDVYTGNSGKNRTERWAVSASEGIPVLSSDRGCQGLFIDIADQIYCSSRLAHAVLKKYAADPSTTPVRVAGNGTAGSGVYQLNDPVGIFVDTKLSLYVADSGNDRVQLFRLGQLNGTTMAGNGTSGTINLDNPCAVVLDGDGYLFIVDRGNHRIVGSGPNGFRCIVGCTETNGSAANQLALPRALSFDSFGNIFVADKDNRRIQKFLQSSNSCGEYMDLSITTLHLEAKKAFVRLTRISG